LLIDQGFATQSKELLSQYVVIFLLLVIALAAGAFYWMVKSKNLSLPADLGRFPDEISSNEY